MRLTLRLIIWTAASAFLASAPANSEEAKSPSLGKVIDTATNVLQKVRAELENQNYPALTSVTMNINTVTTVETSGQVKILVLTVGGSSSNENSRKLSIKLKSEPHKVKTRIADETSIRYGKDRRISDIIAKDLKANLLNSFDKLSDKGIGTSGDCVSKA